MIEGYLTGANVPVLGQTIKRGRRRFIHRYRWLRDVPLRDGRDALAVYRFEIEVISPGGETTYPNSFLSNLPFGRDSAFELAASGRARRKTGNRTFNVVKDNGDNLEHSFGHGKQTLSAILVSLNPLAFPIHPSAILATNSGA